MKPNREMTGTTRLANSGTVVSVRGSVVDIVFEEHSWRRLTAYSGLKK